MNLEEIQKQIELEGADAWVMVDYENKNPTVADYLEHKMLTRKVFLIIPASGKPVVIAHFIDEVFLNALASKKGFDIRPYNTWQEMKEVVKTSLCEYRTILMDISEDGLLPRVSLADYGSVTFIKGIVENMKSSANVMQFITAKLSEKAFKTQQNACKKALEIKDQAFRKIRDDILEKGESDEYEIQLFICQKFSEHGMIYDEAPIVAIGPNASNPHYGPTKETHSSIKEGDLVLIDMWAKDDVEEGVYADITWMGYVGREVPKVYKDRFDIVKAARDGVIDFLSEELPKRKVYAYEADDVARKIITEAGYGKYFKHRVGHNIAIDVSPHGPGANLDNYETHDNRVLIDGTSFSDEPGIYAPDFGMRSETDLHNENNELIVVGGLQEAVIPILSID